MAQLGVKKDNVKQFAQAASSFINRGRHNPQQTQKANPGRVIYLFASVTVNSCENQNRNKEYQKNTHAVN